MPSHTEIGEFIWRIADHLRGDYEKNDNEDVILPFTLLRRLDCVLEKTRDKVREAEAQVSGKVTDQVLKKILVDAAGVKFYNRSRFSFAELLKDPANIKDNFGAWLEGFSDNIKEILYNFSGGEEKGLAPIYETLARKNLLYLITREFASEDLDLHPDRVSNHDMGLAYEYLIRKFKEGAAAGEQYTPRDVVQLLVQLVFADVEHDLKASAGSLIGIYDPACGTGGMLTVSKDYLVDEWGLDPSNVFIYGQELREKTYAICKADALMKGDDGSRIKQGNTLSEDKLIGQQFNFMMANPEFGTDWKKIESFIRGEAERGFDGRFGAGLPDVGDASLLFLQHMISKMTPVDKGGSVIGIVFNGSPLFNGDAGSGWSDIRKWIVTNDWLDAIVALPEDMFYNTNIATYLWIVRNNKPADRKGTITLVNGNQERFRTLMRRNLGKKRVELTPATIIELVSVYREGKPVPKLAQVFDLEDFGYTRVTVERPLRLRFEVTDEGLAAFRQSSYFLGLVATKKVGDKAKADIAKGEVKQQALLAAIDRAKSLCTCRNDRVFINAINDALPFKATAQAIAALRAAFGSTDEKAGKVLLKPLEPDFDPDTAEADPRAWYVTDSELRDEERIPLKTDINAYFAKEVLPYAPDAWMDRSKDKVGYEINFSKHFYEHRPPRKLNEILDAFDLLEKEAEKLQVVIHQAVTKGLDHSIKSKPTGIKWLGDAPEKWSVYRIRHLLRPGKDGMRIGPFGSSLKSEFIRENGYKVYGQENVIGRSFELGQRYIDEEKFAELSDYAIRPGDVLITMMGSIGRCIVVPPGIETGIMDSHLIRVGVDSRKILPEYLALLIESAPYIAANINHESKGSIMDGLNSSIIKQLFILLPSLEEQLAILVHVRQETSKLDALVSKYQRELELLEEYRASLISVAVTGHIDMGGLTSPGQA